MYNDQSRQLFLRQVMSIIHYVNRWLALKQTYTSWRKIFMFKFLLSLIAMYEHKN